MTARGAFLTTGGLDSRKSNSEDGSLPRGTFKSQTSSVLLHHRRVGDIQALPGALAHTPGGKERVENAMPQGVGNSRSGVADPDLNPGVLVQSLNRDGSLSSVP